MKSRILTVLLLVAVTAFGLGSVGAQSSSPGATLYALTSGGSILTIDAANPSQAMNSASITGLGSGETLIGIDVRPATGELFAVSDASRMYKIDPATGTATAVGSGFTPALDGANFGFDFNPTVDRIRLTSSSAQNLRLNPNNGGVAATDGTLAFAAADANAGAAPNIVASAYTNNFAGGTSTTLYNIDGTLNALVTQVPPNDGKLNTIGSLGVSVGANTGFDILGNNLAYASIGGSLYSINLSTGAATSVGSLSSGVVDIAIATAPLAMGSGAGVCGVLSATANSVVRISNGDAGCRLLVANRAYINPPEQIGVQDLVNAGIIQAVDVFDPAGAGAPNGAQVCLLGSGRFIFLNAADSPRVVNQLDATTAGGYTCAFIPSAGTAVLVQN